ncbi:MAG: hypothetical protein KDD66_14835 [Bdellovibrionales bacterium]|nr:hypothetical protein [Bdellovibrionales bacterium]
MKFRIFAAILILFILPSAAAAEMTPAQTLEKIVASLKANPGIAGIADFVHWQTAFEQMPAPQLKEMGISSPEDLKKFYIEAQNDPGAIIRRQMKQRGLPAEQAQMMEQHIAAMSTQLKQRMDEQHTKIKRTTFEIGEASVNGSEAKIPLTTSVDGKQKEDVVTLRKYGNEWLLPGLAFLESTGDKAAAAGGAPAGMPQH